MATAESAAVKTAPEKDIEPAQPAVSPSKTADRPHPITIALGLLSPLLALVSLGVSFYVFRDSQKSMQAAQRAYFGFHLESAEVMPEPVRAVNGNKQFRVRATVSAKNIGNTPAYIQSVNKQLYAIDGDDVWGHIGGSSEVSPNYDALGPKGEPLFIEFNSAFSTHEFTGDRSVVYRVEIHWKDAFAETQPATVFCVILHGVTPPVPGKRALSPEPCIKGFTLSFGSAN